MKQMLNKPAVLTALTGAALAATIAFGAWAQIPPDSPPGPPADLFDAMDSNHDGTVSKAEFDAFKPQSGRFHGDRHDHHPMGPPDLAQLDADKDGKVTLAEFSVPMKDHFDHLDANHDGVLSGEELQRPDMLPPPGR